jgi:hypothetical protein
MLVVEALTPTLPVITSTPLLAVNTFTHLQHTITLLLAVNMRTQLLVLLRGHNTLTQYLSLQLFLVSNMRTQPLVLLRGHNTITLCLHPHRFQDLLLTLLLNILMLLLLLKIK